MNKLTTTLTLVFAGCIAATASAQYGYDRACRPNYSNTGLQLRSGLSLQTRGSYRDDCAACRGGRCGLHGDCSACIDGQCNQHGQQCRCDGDSCNCIPVSYRNDRRRYAPLTQPGSRYEPTGFQRPVVPYDVQRPGDFRTGINWTTDFRQGVAEAQQFGRPMLIRVTADWCGHCTRMKQETYAHSGIIRDIETGFVAIDLDADQNRELVQRMGVQSLPATLVIAPDFRIVDREQGYRSAEQLSSVLRRHLPRAELKTDASVVVR